MITASVFTQVCLGEVADGQTSIILVIFWSFYPLPLER